jgi:hypothetical protein
MTGNPEVAPFTVRKGLATTLSSLKVVPACLKVVIQKPDGKCETA